MNKLDELDKLDRAIKDSSIRLKSIQSAIEQIDKEIAILQPRKNELEQNIEFLKKKDTIPIAQEYKKSKAELTKVKTRLTAITGDRCKADDACHQIEEIIEKFKKDHARLIISSDDNILEGKFGVRRGKK
jgi:chromosome segregation ATPase